VHNPVEANMNIEQMINHILQSNEQEIVETGVSKETYLDFIQRSFQAYDLEELRLRRKKDGDYLDLQSYSRVACLLACLLAGGRLSHLKPFWAEMMTECCKELASMDNNIFADFAIKEIMLSIKVMSRRVDEGTMKEWYAHLQQVDPYKQYAAVIRTSEDEARMHNINVYNMVGEFLRETEGLTDTTAYFDRHWPIQLRKFDAYGMYRDPGCPILYDLTTRAHIQLMLASGYNGTYASSLDAYLQYGGLMTLFTQSVTGELAYGGRSNQFLFNEALIAVSCEYEALRYKRAGMDKIAGAFKRAAHLAILSIDRWLSASPPRHLKNLYPIESGYGTEYYAYYDKYMASFGSFLVMAYDLADDTIAEKATPVEASACVIQTTPSFHKIIASAGGYTIEIDPKPDQQYDAAGLGRIHRKGIPTELALSTPFTAEESYRIPAGLQRRYAAISPGWMNHNGEMCTLSEYGNHVDYEVVIHSREEDKVFFQVDYNVTSVRGECMRLSEKYSLGEEGLHYEAELRGASCGGIFLQVPLLVANGIDQTDRFVGNGKILVELGRFRYQISSETSSVTVDPQHIANRNGEYELAWLKSTSHRISAHFALEATE
jgi:hypothetical protein